MSHTVAVLGAGPAGLFTALELSQSGHQAVVFEQQSSPTWKVGETLPPEACVALQRLGLGAQIMPQDHLPCYGIVTTWGTEKPVEKDYIFHPLGLGLQLDRACFERGLASAVAKAGCHVRWGTHIRSLRPTSRGWSVETDASASHFDWIIDCTGRRGALASELRGAYWKLDDLVSVVAIGRSRDGSDTDARTFVESSHSGWCYSALTPSGRRVIAYQTDSDLLPGSAISLEWLLQKLTPMSLIGSLCRACDLSFPEAPRTIQAHSGRYQNASGHRWLAVGDAAMTYDPVSGQGMAKALEAARCAVQAISGHESYQHAADQWWHDYLWARRSCYNAEGRWTSSPFWARRRGIA